MMNDNKFMGLFAAIVVAACMLYLGLTILANARDLGQWDATPADVKLWFREARQPDTQSSCCGEADAYYADSFEVDDNGQYVAIITDERVLPYRPHVPVGTKVRIPNNKLPNPAVQTPNPTGHGIIFLNMNGVVYCYFPPGGV